MDGAAVSGPAATNEEAPLRTTSSSIAAVIAHKHFVIKAVVPMYWPLLLSNTFSDRQDRVCLSGQLPIGPQRRQAQSSGIGPDRVRGANGLDQVASFWLTPIDASSTIMTLASVSKPRVTPNLVTQNGNVVVRLNRGCL